MNSYVTKTVLTVQPNAVHIVTTSHNFGALAGYINNDWIHYSI